MNPTEDHRVRAQALRKAAAAHRSASQALREPRPQPASASVRTSATRARNGALGHVHPTMAECPLLPPGVSAKVVAVGNGFAVAIRADEPATAKEILRRARLLVEGPENLQAH